MSQSVSRLVKTTTVWIFPPDLVPFPAAATPRSLELLTDKLGVQPLGTNEAGELILGGGSVEVDMGTGVIESMTLGPRRLVLSVLGSKGVFEAVAEQTALALIAIDTRQPSPFRLDTAIVDRTESVVVENLSFDWKQVFAKEFVEFVERTVIPELSDDFADASIARFNFGLEITYKKRSDEGRAAHVRLSPKKIALETRAGSSLDDRLYWSSMPLDTERHRDLLEELTNVLSGATKNKKRTKGKKRRAVRTS